jgi:hypothetical protein
MMAPLAAIANESLNHEDLFDTLVAKKACGCVQRQPASKTGRQAKSQRNLCV